MARRWHWRAGCFRSRTQPGCRPRSGGPAAASSWPVMYSAYPKTAPPRAPSCAKPAKGAAVAEPQRKPDAFTPGDREPLLSGLIPAERLALTVARAYLERGDNPPPGVTAILVMTIDRLLGGPGQCILLEEPRPYVFTHPELVDALRRRRPPADPDGPVVVLEGDAALEALADSIIEALTSTGHNHDSSAHHDDSRARHQVMAGGRLAGHNNAATGDLRVARQLRLRNPFPAGPRSSKMHVIHLTKGAAIGPHREPS